VGPVAHVVLRRLDRRGFVWLVVPAAAVLVSAALYVGGVRRGGRDVLVNVVSHVQIDPDGNTARQAVAAGFFAPTHAHLAVAVPGDTPVRTRAGGDLFGALARAGAPPASEPPIHVVSGRTTRVEFAADESSMRTVSLRRNLDKDVGRITSS